MKIRIVDYKLGNIFNVAKAFHHIGVNAELSSSIDDLVQADALVLPGVGAFGDAMGNLKKTGLDKVIIDFAKSGRQVFGICLGMQLFMRESEEMGNHQGLNLIPGTVRKFQGISDSHKKVRVPLISWQDINGIDKKRWKDSPMKDVTEAQSFYFVHSFYVDSEDSSAVVATSQYADLAYSCVLQKDNIFATQFHPEKSGHAGLGILKNWVERCR